MAPELLAALLTDGSYADDGCIEVSSAQRAEELGIRKGEHASIGGDEVIPEAIAGSRHTDDR
jgi:hypothetical protein